MGFIVPGDASAIVLAERHRADLLLAFRADESRGRAVACSLVIDHRADAPVVAARLGTDRSLALSPVMPGAATIASWRSPVDLADPVVVAEGFCAVGLLASAASVSGAAAVAAGRIALHEAHAAVGTKFSRASRFFGLTSVPDKARCRAIAGQSVDGCLVADSTVPAVALLALYWLCNEKRDR